MNGSGKLPRPTGDSRLDATNELRWAMRGAGLTINKLPLMRAVLALPAVRAAVDRARPELRPHAAYDAVATAARALGNGLRPRILRTSLGIDYDGDAKDLTERRMEFVTRHNERARAIGGTNVIGESMRAMYDIERNMLDALVTALGASALPPADAVPPSSMLVSHDAQPGGMEKAGPWATVDYDGTYRLHGRACHEVEVTTVVRALEDGLDQSWCCYSSAMRLPFDFVLKEGGVVIDDREIGAMGTRKIVIHWPRPLATGETHRLRWDVVFKTDEETAPWYAMQIGRPTERLTIRVSFDTAHLPERVWLIGGIPRGTEGGDPTTSKPLLVDPFGYVDAVFTDPPPGWLYGIGWSWDR